MSHFNEDKDSTLSDPTQRTLLNFIKPGNGNMKVVDEDHSDVKDDSESHCYSYTSPSQDHLSELNDNNEQVMENVGFEDHECKVQVFCSENDFFDMLILILGKKKYKLRIKPI